MGSDANRPAERATAFVAGLMAELGQDDARDVSRLVIGDAFDRSELGTLLVEVIRAGDEDDGEPHSDSSEEAEEEGGVREEARRLVAHLLDAVISARRPVLGAGACEWLACAAARKCMRVSATNDRSEMAKQKRSDIFTRVMCELAHEDLDNAMGSDLSDSLFTYCSMSGSAASQVGGLGISPASAGGDAQGQGQAGGTPEPPRRGGGVINTGNLQTWGGGHPAWCQSRCRR